MNYSDTVFFCFPFKLIQYKNSAMNLHNAKGINVIL